MESVKETAKLSQQDKLVKAFQKSKSSKTRTQSIYFMCIGNRSHDYDSHDCKLAEVGISTVISIRLTRFRV